MGDTDDDVGVQEFSRGAGQPTGLAGMIPQQASALLSDLTGVPSYLRSNLRQQAAYRGWQSRRRAARASIYRPELRASQTSALTGGGAAGTSPADASGGFWRLGMQLSASASRGIGDAARPSSPTAASLIGSGDATQPAAPSGTAAAEEVQHGQQTQLESQCSAGVPLSAAHSTDDPGAKSSTAGDVTSPQAHTAQAGDPGTRARAPAFGRLQGLAAAPSGVGPDLARSAAWVELAEAAAIANKAFNDLLRHKKQSEQQGNAPDLRSKLDTNTGEKLEQQVLATSQRLMIAMDALPAHRVAAQLKGVARCGKAAQSGTEPEAVGPPADQGEVSLLQGVQGDGDGALLGRAVALLSCHVSMYGSAVTSSKVPDEPHARDSTSLRDRSSDHGHCALMLADSLLEYFGLPSLPYPELLGMARVVQVMRLSLPPAPAPNLAVGLPDAPDCVTSINLAIRIARHRVAAYMTSLEEEAVSRARYGRGSTVENDSGSGRGRGGEGGWTQATGGEAFLLQGYGELPPMARFSWRRGASLQEGTLLDEIDFAADAHIFTIDHARECCLEQGGGRAGGAGGFIGKKAVQRFQKAYRDELGNPGLGHSEALGRAHVAGPHAERTGKYSLQLKELVDSRPHLLSFLKQLPRLVAWDKGARAELAAYPAERSLQAFGNMGVALAASRSGPEWVAAASAAAVAAGSSCVGRGGGAVSIPFGGAQQRMQLARAVVEAALDGRPRELVVVGDAALHQATVYIASSSMLRQTSLPYCARSSASIVAYGPLLLRLGRIRPGQILAASSGPSTQQSAPTQIPLAADRSKQRAVELTGSQCQERTPDPLEDCLREASVSMTLVPCDAEVNGRIAERRRYAVETRRRLQARVATGQLSVPSDFIVNLPKRRYHHPEAADAFGHRGIIVSPDEGIDTTLHTLRECLRIYGCVEVTCPGSSALQEAAFLISQIDEHLQATEDGGDGIAGAGSTSGMANSAGEASACGGQRLDVVPYMIGSCQDVRILAAQNRVFSATPLRRDSQQRRQTGVLHEGRKAAALRRQGDGAGVVVDEGWEVARRAALNREMCRLLGLAAPDYIGSEGSELQFDPRISVTLLVLRRTD